MRLLIRDFEGMLARRHGETGWHVPELGRIVEGLGLRPHLATVSCSAENGLEKPHPRAYAAVLDQRLLGEAVQA